jgi:hypothetical protein
VTKLERMRRYCKDGNEHLWKIYRYGDAEHVGCARCMVPLHASTMLEAYVERYGGRTQS